MQLQLLSASHGFPPQSPLPPLFQLFTLCAISFNETIFLNFNCNYWWIYSVVSHPTLFALFSSMTINIHKYIWDLYLWLTLPAIRIESLLIMYLFMDVFPLFFISLPQGALESSPCGSFTSCSNRRLKRSRSVQADMRCVCLASWSWLAWAFNTTTIAITITTIATATYAAYQGHRWGNSVKIFT